MTNPPTMISLVLAVGLATVMATEAPPPPQTTLPDLAPRPPAQTGAVTKAVASGVPAGVIKETGDQQVTAATIYNNLAAYGDWYHLAGFGWCWQPHSWLEELDDESHIWVSLGYGSWSKFRTRGWCWVPSPQLRMSSYLQDVDVPANRVSIANNQGVIDGFGAGSFPSQYMCPPPTVSSLIVINNSPAVGLSYPWPVYSGLGGRFHGISGSFHTLSGGFHRGPSAGFHRGGRGGFHSVAGGGFHGGARSGFHGGGGGGFHGGGRGNR